MGEDTLQWVWGHQLAVPYSEILMVLGVGGDPQRSNELLVSRM